MDKTNPQAVLAFHERLCKIVVLDPACGSGNFLATSFELVNAFDNEVVATLRKLRQPEPTSSIRIQQFRGIEVAPHSADVCELVLRVTDHVPTDRDCFSPSFTAASRSLSLFPLIMIVLRLLNRGVIRTSSLCRPAGSSNQPPFPPA